MGENRGWEKAELAFYVGQPPPALLVICQGHHRAFQTLFLPPFILALGNTVLDLLGVHYPTSLVL